MRGATPLPQAMHLTPGMQPRPQGHAPATSAGSAGLQGPPGQAQYSQSVPQGYPPGVFAPQQAHAMPGEAGYVGSGSHTFWQDLP